MQVMSTSFSGYSVREMTGGREHPLPSPFFSRVRVFTIERIGERAAAQTAIDIVLMHSLYRLLAVASFLEIASAAFFAFPRRDGWIGFRQERTQPRARFTVQ